MPPVLSKVVRSALIGLVLWTSRSGAQTDYNNLPTMPWRACGDWLCGDLYFCALPAETWGWWNKTVGNTMQTWGSRWPNSPFFMGDPNGDPNGSHGYIYTYRSTPPFNGVDGCVPGLAPIIRVMPGKKYKLTFHNTAPKDLPTQAMVDTLVALGPADNIWSVGNTTLYPTHMTNFHLHGVHQSPMGSHDNVLKIVYPGDCFTYHYIIDLDSHGGAQVYHPHFHGKVALQTFGGAYGFFIIEDTTTMLRDTKGGFPDQRIQNFFLDKTIERNLQIYNGFQLWLGNGNPNGAQISLFSKQWHRLRVLVLNPEGLVKWLEFVRFSGVNCTIKDLAFDGTPGFLIPNERTPVVTGRPFLWAVHGATRVEFAVRCVLTTGVTKGTFALKYVNVMPGPAEPGTVGEFTVVETKKLVDASPYLVTPKGNVPWSIVRADHNVDLRDGKWPADAKILTPTFNFSIAFNGINGVMFLDRWVNGLTLNTFEYGPKYVHEIRFMGVGAHPTHTHVQVFQVVSPGGCGPAYAEGTFFDTISSLHPDEDPAAPSEDTQDPLYDHANDCVIRFRNVDYSGVLITHCHILDHEDIGLVGWYVVPSPPGSFEAGPKFVDGNTFGCCAPLRDTSGNIVCRGTPKCIPSRGWSTCNEPCDLPVSTCLSTQVCSNGICVSLDKFAKEVVCGTSGSGGSAGASAGSSSPSESAPIYPWIIMGVAIAVAVVTVIGAVCFIRHRTAGYNTILLEEVKMEPTEMRCFSTPFTNVATPMPETDAQLSPTPFHTSGH